MLILKTSVARGATWRADAPPRQFFLEIFFRKFFLLIPNHFEQAIAHFLAVISKLRKSILLKKNCSKLLCHGAVSDISIFAQTLNAKRTPQVFENVKIKRKNSKKAVYCAVYAKT